MTDNRSYSELASAVFSTPLWRREKFFPLELGQPKKFYAGTPLERKYADAKKIYRLKFDKIVENDLTAGAFQELA